MTTEEFLKNIEESCNSVVEICRKKNADYTGKDNPFKNFQGAEFIGLTIEEGILTRIMDKISRISVLLKQEAQVKDETITDSIRDAIGYLAILKAYIDSKKI